MKKLTSLCFTLFFACMALLAANPTYSLFGTTDAPWLLPLDASSQERAFVEQVYARHPYVALLPNAEAASLADENELRIQDLRGNSCYGQPNQLQVCGRGDTLSLLLFTKSVDPLEDITVTFNFDDGIEYGGFANISSATTTSATLTEISTVNPESPSFLVSEVSEPDGGVVLELGIRAECGVDFSVVNPGVSIEVAYTAGGEACTATLRLEDFGGDNVLAAQVDFAGPAGNVNLGAPNTSPCQTIDVTQTVTGAQATGYRFTASDYGFDEGISISEVRRGGVVLAPTDYTIDPTTGMLELIVNGPTADGLLNEAENERIQVCYTYTECFPNIDFTPIYTVEDLCDGESCSGNVATSQQGRLLSNFSQNPSFTAELIEIMDMPNACSGAPYVFDVVIGSTIADPVAGSITDLSFKVRRCKIAGLGLSSVELVSEDGSTVIGTLGDELFSVSEVDETTETNDTPPVTVPTPNRAGTISVNLQDNASLTGANLVDFDGDGNFDDFAGGTEVRFRFTLAPSCSVAADDDFVCSSVPNFPGGADPGPDCRIREIAISGRRGCGTRGLTTTVNLDGGSEFAAASSSTFTNTADFDLIGVTFNGYDFGPTGDETNNATDDPTVSIQTFTFEYTLDDTDLILCDDPSSANVEMVLVINGADTITEDFVFSNFVFDGTGILPGVPTVVYNEGETILTIPVGDVTPGTTFGYSVDASLDVSTCGPPQLLVMSAFLRTDCNPSCNCVATRTCSNTFLRVDPRYFDCVSCFIDAYAFIDRQSTGYTDDSRTTDVDPASLSEADQLRFIPGDTLKLTGAWVMRNDVTYDFGDINRGFSLRMEFFSGAGDRRNALRDMLSI
ncbi:MAG: hypothetical protein AAF597_05260, partial [Bacteroidota bacterium]